MKKLLFLFVIFSSLVLSAASEKVLVVYFSWSESGNTRQVAEMIARETKGDVEAITPEKPYSRKYKEVLALARKELKAAKAAPVKALKNDLKKYSIVFVGTPIWYGTYATPVRSFLQQNDLKGKKVYFFCTHGKGGPGKFFKDAARLTPGALIGEGFSCYGTHVKKIAPKVQKWVKKNMK